MKHIKYLLLSFFMVPQLTTGQQIDWMPFEWHGEKVDGRYMDKVAMFVPVTIDNMEHRFVMQFDMGSDATIIYGKTFNAYVKENPSLKLKVDDTASGGARLRNAELKAGDHSFGTRNLVYNKDHGNHVGKRAMKQAGGVLIGTMGTDMFAGKVIIIDYPNRKIGIADELPAVYKQAQFQPFRTTFGKIIIAFSINGKKEELLYDTGSSLFAMITNEKNVAQVSTQPNVDSFGIYAWGKRHMVYGKPISADVRLAGKKLPPSTVYYDKESFISKFNDELSVWGIVGNSYFLNSVVLIDCRNNMFGLQ